MLPCFHHVKLAVVHMQAELELKLSIKYVKIQQMSLASSSVQKIQNGTACSLACRFLSKLAISLCILHLFNLLFPLRSKMLRLWKPLALQPALEFSFGHMEGVLLMWGWLALLSMLLNLLKHPHYTVHLAWTQRAAQNCVAFPQKCWLSHPPCL